MSLPGPLESTALALLAKGKGLLAADESLPTIGKRFKELGIASTEESRRDYRELLFTTPGLGESISGAILFDETIRQKASGGTPLVTLLEAQGIIPGIKVDGGAVPLAGFDGEKITSGLDGLRERLADYGQLGARFTKWRAVITIGKGIPTDACVDANATLLALFAALSQEAGMVPIVEPEVLMDGNHGIERCEEVISLTLKSVFEALGTHRVSLGGMLLKSGMVLSAEDCPRQVDDAQVAEATVRCFRRSVPTGVPGIVFLSGGQGDVDATRRLNAICASKDMPWRLTFSYGRALQDAAMRAWGGKPGNTADAQAALKHRAVCNALAVQGSYDARAESGP
jgi:fructose-bisphosphate aldolase class I